MPEQNEIRRKAKEEYKNEKKEKPVTKET